MIIDTSAQIDFYVLCTVRAALRLECVGMKRRGISAARQARTILKNAGKVAPKYNQDLLKAYCAHLETVRPLSVPA